MDEKSKNTPEKGITALNARSVGMVEWNARIKPLKDFSDLYRMQRDENEHQKNLIKFPETKGPELKYVAGIDPINGGRVSGMIFEETGMLGRVHEFTEFHERKKAGGVEPPAFITAKDMANELESLPKSFVEAALDPEETGKVEIILGELKRQGEGFAVAMTRKEEFDDLELWNSLQSMSLDPTMKRINPNPSLYDSLRDLSKEQESNLMWGVSGRDQHLLSERSMILDNPGITMDPDQLPRIFLGGGLIP